MILYSKILGDSKKHILILHGFLGSGDNWKSVGRKLNPLGYTIHLIDQRNHGRSFHSEKFDYDIMCEDLFNYIKYHNINNAILIGHSMGGKTAMNFSLNHPKLVSKLIVLDTSTREYPVLHQNIIDSLKEIDLSIFTNRNSWAYVRIDFALVNIVALFFGISFETFVTGASVTRGVAQVEILHGQNPKWAFLAKIR